MKKLNTILEPVLFIFAQLLFFYASFSGLSRWSNSGTVSFPEIQGIAGGLFMMGLFLNLKITRLGAALTR
jgi:hypothetical protein